MHIRFPRPPRSPTTGPQRHPATAAEPHERCRSARRAPRAPAHPALAVRRARPPLGAGRDDQPFPPARRPARSDGHGPASAAPPGRPCQRRRNRNRHDRRAAQRSAALAREPLARRHRDPHGWATASTTSATDDRAACGPPTSAPPGTTRRFGWSGKATPSDRAGTTSSRHAGRTTGFDEPPIAKPSSNSLRRLKTRATEPSRQCGLLASSTSHGALKMLQLTRLAVHVATTPSNTTRNRHESPSARRARTENRPDNRIEERPTERNARAAGARAQGTRTRRTTAEEIGITTATLLRIESGRLPDVPTFGAVCRWRKTPPAELLNPEKPRKTNRGKVERQRVGPSSTGTAWSGAKPPLCSRGCSCTAQPASARKPDQKRPEPSPPTWYSGGRIRRRTQRRRQWRNQ